MESTFNASRLLLANRQFRRYRTARFQPLLEETGMNILEVNVLLFLLNNPGLDTARDVAELRGFAKSQVSQAVELLSARGFLRREPDRNDRRMVHLRITPAGLPTAQKARAVQTQCVLELLEGLTETEQAQLGALVEKMADRLDALAGKER